MSRCRRPWWGRILRYLCCGEKSENECRAILGDETQSMASSSSWSLLSLSWGRTSVPRAFCSREFGGNYSTDSNVKHMAIISYDNFKYLAGNKKIWRENPACHYYLAHHTARAHRPPPPPPIHYCIHSLKSTCHCHRQHSSGFRM